ncbi:MAG: DUF3048 domain-containing protein [Clostridiales bacterium]|nr:DUF3048 domain-containing protein [Clostridiales bacterium]
MKKLFCLLLAVATVFALSACQKSAAAEEPAASSSATPPEVSVSEAEPEVASEVSSELEPEVEANYAFINPLTGEGTETDVSNNRPYAVMMNSLRKAMPQSGNSQADLYYEIPEEGGVTRIMAVFQDVTDVGKIGSIRSTRPYFVYLAYALDSVLIHAGGSGKAYNALEETALLEVDSLGTGSEVFYRDQARLNAGYSTEHTLYLDSDTLQDWVETSSGYDMSHEEDYLLTHTHTFVEDGTPESGSPANSITVPFSGYKTNIFTYNEDTQLYTITDVYTESGTSYSMSYLDEQTGEAIGVTNVIVIQTAISQIEGDAYGRLDVTLVGSGQGYYACNGKYIPILWSKDSYSDIFTFTTTQGEELSLGVGKTYINIVSTSKEITFTGDTAQ